MVRGMRGNYRRCVVCDKVIGPHHKCPHRVLKGVDRQEEESIEPEPNFAQRLEDAFEMARMSQNYND